MYYRINGLSVYLPALRERTDLLALIQMILQIEQVSNVQISPEAMQVFEQHPWPGNIRQLHNVLRTAIALADGESIGIRHFTKDFMDDLLQEDTSSPQLVAPKLATKSPLDLKQVGDVAIREAMQVHMGNISAVARQLGISRNTLYRKLKLLGLA